MKILLAGGGSGGPVTPVLAVALEIKKLKPHTEFLFIGTRTGPERKMVEEVGIKFDYITQSKLRRYYSPKNLWAPFAFLIALFQSWRIVRKFKPDIIFSAGAYCAVPLSWAGRMSGARIVIHQQDAQIGLANVLIAPFASGITTAFEKTSKDFFSGSGLKPSNLKPVAEWVGNPTRADLLQVTADTKKFFHLHENLPILLVLGGATGAVQINSLLEEILPEIVKGHQVIHQTGTGKNSIKFTDPNYHPVELIPFAQYAAILNQAHIVIARAGLSTIAELSALGKVAIVIPMPNTHQEENAKILKATEAAIVLFKADATAINLKRIINILKYDQKLNDLLIRNMKNLMPKDAAAKIAAMIIKSVEIHER